MVRTKLHCELTCLHRIICLRNRGNKVALAIVISRNFARNQQSSCSWQSEHIILKISIMLFLIFAN